MKFDNVAEAFAFYKNMSNETLESRAKAIQADIAGNPAADMQAYNIELEAIENAQAEKRGAEKPEGHTNPEDRMQHPGFTATEHEDKDDARSSAAYRSAFYKHLVGNDLTPEEKRAFDQVNAERRADAFNTLTNAAAVVPTKLMDEILVKARDHGGLLGISRGLNVPANVRFPIVTPGDPAAWHTEGALVESEKVDPTYIEFGAYEIMRVLSMSVAAKTMTIDALESYLADELYESVMECLARAMVDGDGDKKGTGILTGVEWEQGVNLFEIKEEDWLDWKTIPLLISKIHRHYATGAHFVMSNETLYQDIITLHDDDNNPLYVFDLQNANTGRLLGFPVTIDDYLEPHDILLGNFGKYMAYNLPQGLMLDVSRESSFKYGLIDYRAMAIADCKPIITEPFVRMRMGE